MDTKMDTKRTVGTPKFLSWAWCPFWYPFFDQMGYDLLEFRDFRDFDGLV